MSSRISEVVLDRTRQLVREAHGKKEYRPVAVAIIENQHGKLLFVQSAKNKALWYLPQGGIEEKEDVVRALFREVREELGIPKNCLTLVSYRGMKDLDAEKRRSDKRGFTRGKRYFFFRLKLKKPPAIVLRTTELSDYSWICYSSLPDVLTPMRKERAEMTAEMIFK